MAAMRPVPPSAAAADYGQLKNMIVNKIGIIQ
uniref:Uncharacterized protein n=2 Tax=Oryza sativa subsp. japonica TaxID=39947 RepID=Q2R7M1_ORYSJ|nr:hypothetical protein LOC_Os11g15650 [Oryza sativa Japonica Group]ABA92469.1 hypothetical protein LOC_Os11g15649 [Oryza sativa Japonica Group]